MRDLEKVCIQPKYNYCTGEERFTFIKLPKCLVEDEGFVELSMDITKFRNTKISIERKVAA